MAIRTIDIHPHIITTDEAAYPRTPLFGVQSGWSKQRPITIERMVAEMDAAGVDKSAIVQASTCYGFDNSYLADSIARYPGRFVGVGSIDMAEPTAVEKLLHWHSRGIRGLRIFTGGSSKEYDPSVLDDPATYPVWFAATDLGVPICIQTNEHGLEPVKKLATRFPSAKIVIDHLSQPRTEDGPPYAAAAPLFSLVPFRNIHFKLTPNSFQRSKMGRAAPETFFPKLMAEFGAARFAWGSNFPATEGPLSNILGVARAALACLTQEDQDWIFAKTALSLYPALG